MTCVFLSGADALILLTGTLSPPSSLPAGRLWSLGIRDAVAHHQPVKWEARALYGCRRGEGKTDNRPLAVNPQRLVLLFLVVAKSAQ